MKSNGSSQVPSLISLLGMIYFILTVALFYIRYCCTTILAVTGDAVPFFMTNYLVIRVEESSSLDTADYGTIYHISIHAL